MRTRTSTDTARVAVESYPQALTTRWRWIGPDGRLTQGFDTSVLAVEDAQRYYGSSVRITHHSPSVSREAGDS
jgi:hypothetical protein